MLKLPENSGIINSRVELFVIVGINNVGTIRIIDKNGINILEILFKDIKKPPRIKLKCFRIKNKLYNKNSKNKIKKDNASAMSFLAGALGVEPSSVVLETIILPMYYAPI